MKDCLEDHREDPGFSAECKEEFEIMMEARAADFRCARPGKCQCPALSQGLLPLAIARHVRSTELECNRCNL